MAGVNTAGSPYYDDYQLAKDKNFVKLLALPGRVEQAREFTQVQSIFLDLLKRLGDTILRNGGITEGCSLSVKDKKATISPGKVYFDGIIYNIPETTVAIAGVGAETIGVLLQQNIVTEEQDSSLLDPAQGYANYSQPGAHRLQSQLQFVANDPTACKLFDLVDGQQLVVGSKPDLDIIIDLLARRTYDESGNYKVSGMEMSYENVDANYIRLIVNAGKAYVKGYEVSLVAPVKALISKALSTRQVTAEPKVYTTGTTAYKLNNFPVKQIDKVVAIVETTKSINRGNIGGGIDYLPSYPVVSITTIKQGGTTYVAGTDFQLTGDGVDWSLSGIEPAVGSTYDVTWRYNRTMVNGTDYTLTESNGVSYINFPTTMLPVSGSNFNVDYQFYLARKDTVTMDKNGNLHIVAGQSDLERVVSAPYVSDGDLLILGTVLLPARSTVATLAYSKVSRLSMSEIQNLATRIEDMEYNQSVDALDTEAMAGESPTLLKGIFSDGFISLSKADTGFADFNVTYDLDNNNIALPFTESKFSPVIDSTSPTNTAKKNGVTISNPFTEYVMTEQGKVTQAMLVNPYAVYDKASLVILDPKYDNFVTQIYTTKTANRSVPVLGLAHQPWRTQSWTTTTVTNKVDEEVAQNMGQTKVGVIGENFSAFADNLSATFNDLPINLTPVSPSVAGTTPGSMRADAKGRFQATFVVPENVPVGSVAVKVGNANNESQAVYSSQGVLEINTMLTTKTLYYAYDPLAQSFIVPKNQYISSVGLYFMASDPSNNAIVQIRNMVNGYPGRDVYAQKVLTPDMITASATGNIETKVVFDDPVYCTTDQEYCFVILTDSSAYSLGVAELGKKDLNTDSYVNAQPYVAGVLFSSSNASSWTAHNAMDLRFKLYSPKFALTSRVEYKEWVPPAAIDQLVLASDGLAPSGTRVDWEIAINGNTVYASLTPSLMRSLSEMATKVKVRATLTGTGDVSPLIYDFAVGITGCKSLSGGAYVGRTVALPQMYTTVKQIIELSTPSPSSATVKFSTDEGATWVTPTQVSSEAVDNEFSRVTYTATLSGAGANSFKARVELATTNTLIRPRVRRFMNIMK